MILGVAGILLCFAVQAGSGIGWGPLDLLWLPGHVTHRSHRDKKAGRNPGN